MKLSAKHGAALGALALAAALVVAWTPLAKRRTRALPARVEQAIATRAVFATPAEVLTLLHDRRVALAVFDVRRESSYQRVRLVDARHFDRRALLELPADTLKVLVGEDDADALAAYRDVAMEGVKNLYVLEGGMRGWIDTFSAHAPLLDVAVGGRHPVSDPWPEVMPTFVSKIKLPRGSGKKAGGGCGG